jgi:ankyrin repeat protein
MACDTKMARILLDHGAAIESAPFGATPLHLAVSTGPEDLVKLLLERGADPKAKFRAESGRGKTVLHIAVSS